MASFASVPAKGLPPKQPDKGSFPLDHFRECSQAKELYMACLKEHMMNTQTEECRELSAAYLQCRMDSCAATTHVQELPDARTRSVPRARRIYGVSRGVQKLPTIVLRHHCRKLMAKQEMEKLGYYNDGKSAPASQLPAPERSREKKGFVAGTRSDA